MEILEKLSFVNHLAQDLVRPRNFVYVDSPPCTLKGQVRIPIVQR